MRATTHSAFATATMRRLALVAVIEQSAFVVTISGILSEVADQPVDPVHTDSALAVEKRDLDNEAVADMDGITEPSVRGESVGHAGTEVVIERMTDTVGEPVPSRGGIARVRDVGLMVLSLQLMFLVPPSGAEVSCGQARTERHQQLDDCRSRIRNQRRDPEECGGDDEQADRDWESFPGGTSGARTRWQGPWPDGVGFEIGPDPPNPVLTILNCLGPLAVLGPQTVLQPSGEYKVEVVEYRVTLAR